MHRNGITLSRVWKDIVCILCLLAVVEEANVKMSPENSGEVLYKQHAILREKGSTRGQQSWQLHGTVSSLCGEEVGIAESV